MRDSESPSLDLAPIRFGVIIVMFPPVGMNVFVIKGAVKGVTFVSLRNQGHRDSQNGMYLAQMLSSDLCKMLVIHGLPIIAMECSLLYRHSLSLIPS